MVVILGVAGVVSAAILTTQVRGYDPLANSLSASAQQELQQLPAGTHVASCGPVSQLPTDVRQSKPAGFWLRNPGFYILVDGHCALDPSATLAPFRDDAADDGGQTFVSP
jgi:hypothetical protein